MKKPIRILHIVSIMNHGGIEHLLMDIYRNLDRDKIQFDFLITRDQKGVFDDEIKTLGGKIFNLIDINNLGYFKFKNQVNEFFKKDDHSIIHCHMNTWAGFFLPLAKKNDIPIRIAHSHIADTKLSFKNLHKYLLKKYHSMLINNNSTHFFACSKDAGKWLFGDEIANNNLKIIKNGIKVDKFKYNKRISDIKRDELKIKDNELLLGHVGRFSEQKNHKFIIEIFDEILELKSDSKLCLVGQGPLLNNIKTLVRKKEIEDKVLFLGDRNDVNELMMAFDVFLFPSFFEGFGIAALESQASGLKTFISNKVPNEINITNLVNRISLDKSKQYWAKEIIKNKEVTSRSSYSLKIVEAGYDINNTVKDIEEFYLNVI
jgi:glycosyltransferase involved in cell wall biosynthesis